MVDDNKIIISVLEKRKKELHANATSWSRTMSIMGKKACIAFDEIDDIDQVLLGMKEYHEK